MAWKREGLLTDAEFERAKEKILAEEPHHDYACMPLCVPHRSLASENMARGGGGENARVFAIGVILGPILVFLFGPSLHRVLREMPKMGCPKVAKSCQKVRVRAVRAVRAVSLGSLREKPPI